MRRIVTILENRMYKLVPPESGSTDSAPPLLVIRNLSCAYTSRAHGLFGRLEKKPVLDNINLEIKQGEIFGLSGESGCGKSTIARCILGLIDYTGDIFINGENRKNTEKTENREKTAGRSETGKSSRQEQRLHLARLSQMVFQDSGASLNPVKSIGWLLEEAMVIHNLYTKEERKAKVDEMLIRVGLDPTYSKRMPHELSGGQKQRVCIGRSLILAPQLLIADEAINSLDVGAGAQILNLFRDLNRDFGIGILFISHNKNAAEYLCDRIAEFK